MKTVFIDGQAGTTGLRIFERLKQRQDIEIIQIPHEQRKDTELKKKYLNNSDLVILCLPDKAAKESAALITNPETKVVDASTAHRVNPDWTYGFPEYQQGQREKIRNSKRVANCGCHAIGLIAGLYPLVKNGIVPSNYPITAHSLTGYSGGGRQLIERYENLPENQRPHFACRPYALALRHKHLPEMAKLCGLDYAPVFEPVLGNYYNGMIVTLPFCTRLLNKKMSAKDVWEILSDYYQDEYYIRVKPFENEKNLEHGALPATECNETNFLDILVFGHEEQILVATRFDNLGKGASGSAVQNMNIMLGLDEKTGL